MSPAFLQQMKMEWSQQLARPFVWFSALTFFLLSLGASLEYAWGTSGYTWMNGADAIGTRALILSILGIIVAAGVIGDAACRDKTCELEETILVTGVNRLELSLGRFIPAFFIVLVISAMFIPGMIVGSFVPGIAEEKLGPFVFGHYIKAMGIYVIPNFFLVSSLIFSVSARWRSQTLAFIVALALIAMYVSALMLLGKDVYRHEVFKTFALFDPYGNIAGAELSMTWTVAQNNTIFRPFESLLLMNRIIWAGVSCGLIVLGIFFTPLNIQPSGEKKSFLGSKLQSFFKIPEIRFASNNEFIIMLLWELKLLSRQPGILLLMGFAAFSLWWTAASSVTHSFSLPSTDLLIHTAGYYFDKILILLLVWYAADLVWREKTINVDQIIDTLPTRDNNRFLSKTIALMIVVLTFWLLAVVVNIGYQVAHGYYEFEFDLYFIDTLFYKAPYYLWMAVLAMSAQIVIRQRYIAIAVVLLVYLAETLLDALGWYHPLYRFGNVSFFWYSLMDGYGHFWTGHIYYLLYWSLFCAGLWQIAKFCYTRGMQPPKRMAMISQKLFSGRSSAIFLTLTALTFLTGGYIYYQTKVLNQWPLFSNNQYMAHIEKEYRAEWGKKVQPQISKITAKIDIYPKQRKLNVKGQLVITNTHQKEITELLVFFHPQLKTAEFIAHNQAVLIEEKSNAYVQYWQLTKPLLAGESLAVGFHTASFPDLGFAAHAQHDDSDQVSDVEVIGNGTSLLNLNLMPAFGYSERLEHKPEWQRKKYGLEPQWTLPESTVGKNSPHETTHLTWVESMDVTVSTSADQVPLHSGKIVEDYFDNENRRVIRYLIDTPSKGWSEILSGRYAIHKEERPNLPPIELYHHPQHDYTLKEMSEYLFDAMDYYSLHYGTPPFDTFRLAEASIHYNSFGARRGLGFTSEVLGWKTDLSISEGEDIRQYASNFMGINWWNDQLIAGNTAGAKIITVGLPFWTSILHLHRARSPELSRKIRIQDMMEMYRSRAQLEDVELPFIKEMKNSSMVRQKGAVSILYLAELLGPDKLEKIFADFLLQWAYQSAPYPTGDDLVEHFHKAISHEFSPQIDDVFINIANWRLKVVKAKTSQLSDGKWKLTAKIDVHKLYSSGLGVEEEAELNTPLFIGIFRDKTFSKDSIIRYALEKGLSSGENNLEFILDEKPVSFGVDPYLLLPDANPYDNVRNVSIEE